MIEIRKIKNIFQKYGALTLGELHILSKETKEDLSIVLNEWTHRGRISKSAPQSFCCGSGCAGCVEICSSREPEDKSIYRWVQAA